jgi:uncharacterized protein (TIGR03083 family)
MDYTTFVEHVRADGLRLSKAATAAGMQAAVPSCPGWSVDDLVRHIAQVYEHKIACTALGKAPDPWPPEWPADRDPIEWFGDAHVRLLSMFAANGPQTHSATWWPPDQTVGFWARRMAQETAVHRVDAELAAGEATPVDPALAVDGVDEILRLMLEGDWSDEPEDDAHGQRVAVSTGDRSWIITMEREKASVDEDAGGADATIGGEPSDVYLWLWGRAPDERVTREGDEDVVRLLRSWLVRATQ